MALKITCPHCGRPLRLEEPYPLPGAERQCACGRALSISYPVGLIDTMRKKGAAFEGDLAAPPAPVPRAPSPQAPRTPEAPKASRAPEAPRPERGTSAPTHVDRPRPSSREPTEVVGRDTATDLTPAPAARAAPPPPLRPARKPRPPPPRRSWGRSLIRGFVVLSALVAGTVVAGALAVSGIFWFYSRDLPTVETLGTYRPPTVTVVYDRNQELMGEIYEKRRYVTALADMPDTLKEAFLAAEDAGFYSHGGVDYVGIFRAVVLNTLQGRKAQGASTITQQVARTFLLSSEKTYTRKIREISLAWRIEEAFDKDHILYLYLNQIYLGSGAYGVEAAARVYFGKHVGELTLAEAAMIAGLPQRPSDYSPHRHFEKAKTRQRYVLEQMVDKGFATRAEAGAALEEDVQIVERTNEFLLKAPWFTEQVRRYLVEKYGFDRVYNEGLVVHATCDLALQREAQRVVSEQVTAVDEKRGWRGVDEHLDESGIVARIEELRAKGEARAEGERYAGVVLEAAKKHAIVDLGGAQAILPLAWHEWAYKPDAARNAKYRKQDDLTRALSRGDVVTVEVVNRDFRDAAPFASTDLIGPYAAGTLYQAPELQGALYSYNLEDGAVLAMVGGVDFKATEFNRAVQAYRQVGSTFKPIVYAAAIESKRFTAGTILQDAPLIYNTTGAKLYKPENYGEDYLGDITLRRALALSRNVVTIRVLDQLGLDPVEQMARRLGITSKFDVDLAMGLGSASLTIPEITRAYSAFATGGALIEPHLIDKVVDRDAKVLESFRKPATWEQPISAEVAGVMNYLLQEVASAGTAAAAQKLGVRVAGKTGTTDEFRDAWFVGYTPGVIASVWVGYDNPRSIGASSTGGSIALPIWMDYMEDAFPKSQDRPFPAKGNLSWVGVDESTGRPLEGGRSMPFLPGTAPKGVATEAGQKTAEELLTSEF